MKGLLYPRLAWSGIRGNRRLYVPYILTCVGMIMMFYIIAYLAGSSNLRGMSGGSILAQILGFGVYVMGFFSFLFLFYTNSFLIRRRKKEFGLYNILGMGKRHLAGVLVCENLMVDLFALAAGLILGVLFSKLAELCMVNILQIDVNYSLSLNPESLWVTVEIFAGIFLLILVSLLIQVYRTRPIELLESEHTGEKPPKGNWLLALAGGLLLAGAYYLAVTTENPLVAIGIFFVAVIMVIAATYLLFIAGSVALCKLLMRRKSYYYQTNHFVSVSSLIYRMKRNGAGLASICILCTMMLVTLMGTMCLYIGAEGSLRNRYPRHINLDIGVTEMQILDFGLSDSIRSMVKQTVEENLETEASGSSKSGEGIINVVDYRLADVAAYIADGRVVLDEGLTRELEQSGDFYTIWQVFVVPLEDYNRLMDTEETLAADEVLVYTTKATYDEPTIALGDGPARKVRKTSSFVSNGVDAVQIVPTLFLFVPDFEEAVQPLAPYLQGEYETLYGMPFHWYYQFDMEADAQVQERTAAQILEGLGPICDQAGDHTVNYLCESVAHNRQEFYELYGGLFFLGILLGSVFLAGAVLIIYYKQVSEGYEDRQRFEIMQKVGMTKADIRHSINSQLLTVFFLPLLMAGLHMAFAFPLVRKLLMAFAITDLKLLITVAAGCFLAFACFYVFVYKITSRAYYQIVSGE